MLFQVNSLSYHHGDNARSSPLQPSRRAIQLLTQCQRYLSRDEITIDLHVSAIIR